MAITPERKAQLDALIQQQKQGAPVSSSGITPERKAQLDQMIADYKNKQSPAQPIAQEPKERDNILTNLASPFTRGILAPIAGVASGVGKLLQGKPEEVHDAATRERDFGLLGKARPLVVGDDGNTVGVGEATKRIVGTGAEIASYLAPVGGIERAVGGVAAHTLPGIARGIAGSALMTGAGGALGSAGRALADDKNFGQVIGEGAKGFGMGAAAGAALPVAGLLTRGAGKIVGRGVTEALGKTTGASTAAISEAIHNPNVAKFIREAGSSPERLIQEAHDLSRGALEHMMSDRGSAYRAALENFKADPTDMSGFISDLRQKVVHEAQDNYRLRFGTGDKVNNLDFGASDIVGGEANVQKAFDRLFGEKINTVADADAVKKSLGKLAKGANQGSPAQSLIFKMKGLVDETLKTKVKGYAEAMGKYADASDMLDEFERTLSLGDNAMKETTLRKFQGVLRQDNELRQQVVKALEERGGGDIMGRLAAARLHPLMPRGIAGALGAGGLTISGVVGNLPGVLAYLAASSPRLVAEAASIAGKIQRGIATAAEKTRLLQLVEAARSTVE